MQELAPGLPRAGGRDEVVDSRAAKEGFIPSIVELVLCVCK